MTWLYGPLQPGYYGLDGTRRTGSSTRRRGLSNANRTHKKPILKKRSLSELMLRRSVSSASLLKRAASAVNAQNNQKLAISTYDPFLAGTPGLTQTNTTMPSYSGSGVNSPNMNSWKNVRFHDLVEQCVALALSDEEGVQDINSADDDDVFLMRSTPKRTSNASPPRINLETNSPLSKTIEKLPHAPLKSPEEDENPGLGISNCPALDINPSRGESGSVFVDRSDDEEDDHWKPPKWFHNRKDSVHILHDKLDAIKRNIGTSSKPESLLDTPLPGSPLESPDSERNPVTFKLAAFSFTSTGIPAESSPPAPSAPIEESTSPLQCSWSAPVAPSADYFRPNLSPSYAVTDDDGDDYDWIETYAPRDTITLTDAQNQYQYHDHNHNHTNNHSHSYNNTTNNNQHPSIASLLRDSAAPRTSSDSGYASSDPPTFPDPLNRVRDTYKGVEMEKERAFHEWDLYPGAWGDLELEEAVAWSRGF